MNEFAPDLRARRRRRDPAASRRLPGLRFAAAWIDHQAATLDPGYFALVMATGIVSNAFFLEGQRVLADVLFAVNIAAYASLWLLTLLRAARASNALREDLLSPRRVFLFFTVVAATDVFAMSVALRGYSIIALALWFLAAALWFALIYLGFGVLMFCNSARVADVVEGAWLNAIVGTQSLVILGGAVALPALHVRPQTFIMLPMLWTIGLILYGILIACLSYRLFFSALHPHEVTPPLWVVMGAAAISVNAGSILTQEAGVTPFLHSLAPFVDGLIVAIWAWATWWIPLLLALGVWKHVIHRVPLNYTPMLWSIVFPLGMYAAATLRLAEVTATPALHSLSWGMAWVALAAWCATGAGMLSASLRHGRALIGLARLIGSARA